MSARRIFMVGIGGIGMSALAQLLASRGARVSGSDRDESPTTELLERKGVVVVTGHHAMNVPENAELLIYSDAIPHDNPERARARELGIPEESYFQALGDVSRSMKTLAVAGTHGKTTTTGMLAKILEAAGMEPTAVVGSIVRDFGLNSPEGAVGRTDLHSKSVLGSNFLAGRDDLLVVEACEYRDHLLEFSPQILVITNIELDHTDYFPDIDALVATFRKAAHSVPADGYIVSSLSSPHIADVVEGAAATVIDYTAEEVPALELIGEFNAMNARAAAAAARAAFPAIEQGTIDRALLDFKGSWRRFEYKGETPSGALVYDDYAHHPTAITKTLEATRQRFPDRRIVVAFHPHLYSRTKSFLKEFGESLALADYAIIAPIYAAREPYDPSVSNEILAREIIAAGGDAAALPDFDAIRDELLKERGDSLIIAMGAGDIYKVAEQIAD